MPAPLEKGRSNRNLRRPGVTKATIQYEDLAADLVRAVRGKRSQIQASRALGFSFNQIGKWESREKKILWLDFCRLNKACEGIVAQALRNLSLGYSGNEACAILNEMKADRTATAFAKVVGYPRLQLTRWLNGKVEIPLADMLAIIQATRNGLTQFAKCFFVEQEQPQSLNSLANTPEDFKTYFKKPWTALLHLVIEHKDCPAAPLAAEFISSLIGVSVKKVTSALNELLAAEILEIDSEGSYKTVPGNILSSHRPDGRMVQRHWAKCVSDAYESLPQEEQLSLTGANFFTSLVIGVSPSTWNEIVKKYRTFLESVRQTIEQVDDSQQSEYKILVFQAVDVAMAGQRMDLTQQS